MLFDGAIMFGLSFKLVLSFRGKSAFEMGYEVEGRIVFSTSLGIL